MDRGCYVPKYDRPPEIEELTGDLRGNAFPGVKRDQIATEMGIRSRKTLSDYEGKRYPPRYPQWGYLTFLARVISERAESEGCSEEEIKQCREGLLRLLSSARRRHNGKYANEKEPSDWNCVIEDAHRFERRDRATLLRCLGRKLDKGNSVRLDQLIIPVNAMLLDTTRQAYEQVKALVLHQITEFDPSKARLTEPLRLTGDLYKLCCLELLRKHEGPIATDTKVDSPFWTSEFNKDLKDGNVAALQRLGATHANELVRRFIQLEREASDYLTHLSAHLSLRKEAKRSDEIQVEKTAFFRLKRNMDELISWGCVVKAGRGAWETPEEYYLKCEVDAHRKEAEMLIWGDTRIQFFITTSGIVTNVFDYSAAVKEFERKRAASKDFYERQWNDPDVMDGSEFLKKVEEIYARY